MDKTTKSCNVCKQEKPVLEFHRNRASKDGLAKRCKPCSKVIMAAQYAKDPRKWRAREKMWQSAAPEKYAALMERKATAQREWRLRNPDAAARIDRKKKYKQLGFTPEDYDRVYAEQGGLCALCGSTGENQRHSNQTSRLHVDHCHSTGKVRGLLCFLCNSALGKFKDSIPTLLAAVEYLKRYQV
jgi:hypothetical protein